MTLPLPQPPADFSVAIIEALFVAFEAVVTSLLKNIGVVKYGPTAEDGGVEPSDGVDASGDGGGVAESTPASRLWWPHR
jgi:hypothetical protein